MWMGEGLHDQYILVNSEMTEQNGRFYPTLFCPPYSVPSHTPKKKKKKGNLKCSGENQQAPWKKLKDTDITFVFNYTTFILVEQVYFTDKDDF